MLYGRLQHIPSSTLPVWLDGQQLSHVKEYSYTGLDIRAYGCNLAYGNREGKDAWAPGDFSIAKSLGRLQG